MSSTSQNVPPVHSFTLHLRTSMTILSVLFWVFPRRHNQTPGKYPKEYIQTWCELYRSLSGWLFWMGVENIGPTKV